MEQIRMTLIRVPPLKKSINMTENAKKKKKTDQIIAVWTNLKQNLIKTISELKANQKDNWALTKPKSTPQSVWSDQINVPELVQENRQLHYLYSLETSLHNRAEENKAYEARLARELQKLTNLEQKLEKIRNLVADQQLNKLIALYKKGEI